MSLGGFRFCNLSALDHELLGKRIAALTANPPFDQLNARIKNLRGDSNELVREIVDGIPSYAYVLVFADIEGPGNLLFTTIQTLRSRHRSVDLYVLFPTRMGFDRLIPYDDPYRNRELLTCYFGSDEWIEIAHNRTSSSQRDQLVGDLRGLYIAQLSKMWKYVKPQMRVWKGNGEAYDMLFATDSDVAIEITKGADRTIDQLGFFDGIED